MGSSTGRSFRHFWYWRIAFGFALVLVARYLYVAIYHPGEMIAEEKLSSNPVVVVGGGLAGLSAAFEALKAGSKVLLIEKNVISGNSAKATSGINAVNSQYQLAEISQGNIQDNVDSFVKDTLKAGHYTNDPKLVKVLAARSGPALDILTQEFNLTLSDIQQLGGHSTRRTHRFPPKDGRVQPVGWTVVSTLKKRFLEEVEKGNAQAMEHSAVTGMDFATFAGADGKTYRYVIAIDVKNSTDGSIRKLSGFRSVVMSAGGYAADSTTESVLARYRPDLVGFPTTNDPTSTGDMLKIALDNGLETTGLEDVQLHPTGFVDPKDPESPKKFLCPEVMRGVGAILVNVSGHRFVDELMPRDHVAAAIRENGGTAKEWGLVAEDKDTRQKIAMMIMTQTIAEKFGIEAFKFYNMKGFIQTIESKEDFKQKVPNADFDQLIETCELYDYAADGMLPDQFNKTSFPTKINGLTLPFYIAFVTPALHFTMGGVHIDTLARALETNGTPTLNLFAAGETAGGVHGGNRLGGNGCLESIVFGQIAGRSAARLPADMTHSDAKRSIQIKKGFRQEIVEVDESSFAIKLDLLSDLVANIQDLSGSDIEIMDHSGKAKGQIQVRTAEQVSLGTLKLTTDATIDIMPGDFAQML